MEKRREKKTGNKVFQNTIMLYIMNITKLVLPLITLPYLTRILSVDSYGVVTYVKSIMTYMQLIIDFGFILSATKNIVRANNNKKKIGIITGNVILGKIILSIVSFLTLVIMLICIPILRENSIFTLLSFLPVFLTTFLLDFLFRGIEKMEVITYRYLIMKGIATILTFVFVKNDGDLMFIPLLDVLGTVIAILWVNKTLKKIGVKILFSKFKDVINSLKESFSYFLSNIATTAFSALNTVIIGIVLTKNDIAYWSIVMQLINAVQALYSPVIDGIYPQMVRDQKIGLVRKTVIIFTPFVLVGCGITFFGASLILGIIGGHKYVLAGNLLRMMIPVMFFSFYSMLFGWPVLGAIDKVKETTLTTIATSIVQVFGLILLLFAGKFTLVSLTILRAITEFTLLVLRLIYCLKYRFNFKDVSKRVS